MARFDDESWLFVGMVGVMIGIVGILVSKMSSEAEEEKELVISTSMSVASGSLTSSVHDIVSIWSGMIWEMVEAVSRLVVCCWGLSEATSSEATSEAFCSTDSTSGSSLE